ncbi:MAG TPA: 50S ribosomal protein L29 [Candidatus Magasanikbacteria bacterium]|nr:50S ribosomal protein L29 [Candidatus Magasanikbacteria bacterium]
MEYTDIKNLSEKDLRQLLADNQNELRELRFKAGERQLKNFNVIKETRRAIAKIITAQKNRATVK